MGFHLWVFLYWAHVDVRFPHIYHPPLVRTGDAPFATHFTYLKGTVNYHFDVHTIKRLHGTLTKNVSDVLDYEPLYDELFIEI